MAQLSIGVSALNHDSVFQAAYEKGMKKTDYWTYTLEDCLNLVGKLPTLAARIYRNVYHSDKSIAPIDKNLDLVGESNIVPLASAMLNLIKATTPMRWVSVTIRP